MSKRKKTEKRDPIDEKLRAAVAESKKTRYRISKEAGLDKPTLARFMKGAIALSPQSQQALADSLEVPLDAAG